jgi:Domain of unknown function (DUF4398)
MTVFTRRNAAFAFVAVSAALASGCATREDRPTEELTEARTLIDHARQSGANEYASREVQSAQDKLHQAELAADRKNHAVARRLAVEASLDAQLATARTRSGKAESAAEQVEASVRTLREEAARGRVQP